MRWARWLYRLVAVTAGLTAASIYAMGHARFGDDLNYAADDPANAQAVAAGVIAVGVSATLIALHEVARRGPTRRRTRWIGNTLLWISVVLFAGVGRALGGEEVISSFDVFMAVASGIVASSALTMATAGDSPDRRLDAAGRK